MNYFPVWLRNRLISDGLEPVKNNEWLVLHTIFQED